MDMTRTMNEQIVECLYDEAVGIAEEVRATFAGSMAEQASHLEDTVRIALSIEGMRATTRVMNVLAWLLNQKAFFNGELSARQLHRRNKLNDDLPADDTYRTVLEPGTQTLIDDVEQLYRRITRLDCDWREQDDEGAGPVQEMRGQLTRVFATR